MRGKGSHFMSSQPKIRKNWSVTWRHAGLLVVEHLWLGSCRGLHLLALPGQSFSLVFSASEAHCSYSSKSAESYTRDPRDSLISFCASVSVSPTGPNSLSSHCPSLLPSFFGVLSLWTTYHLDRSEVHTAHERGSEWLVSTWCRATSQFRLLHRPLSQYLWLSWDEGPISHLFNCGQLLGP